jgi:prepilin-type N-terminal cleavage/methylation domain-containing protein
MHTHRSGFTMIELLLVIVVIGILSLFSLNRTTSILNGWRVSRAAQAYGEELQAAFALVGRNRRPFTITMDTVNMELRITDRNGTSYRKRNFGPTSAYKLTSKDLTLSRLSLEVYPPGLAADSMSVVISRLGKVRRIRLLRGGLVQVCASLAPNACQPG